MPRKTPPSYDEPDLLTLLAEQEHGPPSCTHRFIVGSKSRYAWVCETDPASPYHREWVHSDPACRRSSFPGKFKQVLPTTGWNRKLQKDVPLNG